MRWFTRFATNPNWKSAGRMYDWRNYISEEIRSLWTTLPIPLREALVRQAQEIAAREELEDD